MLAWQLTWCEQKRSSPHGGVWTCHMATCMCLRPRVCARVIREIKHALQDNANSLMTRMLYTH